MKFGSSSAPEPSGRALDNAHDEHVCKSYNSCSNTRWARDQYLFVQCKSNAGCGSNQISENEEKGQRRTPSSGGERAAQVPPRDKVI